MDPQISNSQYISSKEVTADTTGQGTPLSFCNLQPFTVTIPAIYIYILAPYVKTFLGVTSPPTVFQM
jgi:hypothetical protein